LHKIRTQMSAYTLNTRSSLQTKLHLTATGQSFTKKFSLAVSFPPRRVAFSTWQGQKDGWNDIYSTDIVVYPWLKSNRIFREFIFL